MANELVIAMIDGEPQVVELVFIGSDEAIIERPTNNGDGLRWIKEKIPVSAIRKVL